MGWRCIMVYKVYPSTTCPLPCMENCRGSGWKLSLDESSLMGSGLLWFEADAKREQVVKTENSFMEGHSQRSGGSYSDKDDSSRLELLRNRRKRNRESAQRTRSREISQRKQLMEKAAAVETRNVHLKRKVKSSSTHLKIMTDVIINKWGVDALPQDVRMKYLQGHKGMSEEQMIRSWLKRELEQRNEGGKGKKRGEDFENEKTVSELAEILDKIICGDWSTNSSSK